MSIFSSYLTLVHSVKELGEELGFQGGEPDDDVYEGREDDMTPFEEDMPETHGADV